MIIGMSAKKNNLKPHVLTEHGKCCMQNNQLPTKTHVELKDNSIVSKLSNNQMIHSMSVSNIFECSFVNIYMMA